jgi:hypothetical protein
LDWRTVIAEHYRDVWGVDGQVCRFAKGPIAELPADFAVLRFPPRPGRTMWTYATRCMSQAADQAPLELHLFSPRADDGLAELLVVTAHYHRTGSALGLHHSVDFGRPWLDDSICDHGLVSLPYLDGPPLENLVAASTAVRFLWLVPVTASELAYRRAHGTEALEARFEQARFNYLDPARPAAA